MQELQGGGYVTNNHGGLSLREAFPPLNMVEELTTSNLLEHEVKPLRFLKVFDQLNNVSVTLKLKIYKINKNIFLDLKR